MPDASQLQNHRRWVSLLLAACLLYASPTTQAQEDAPPRERPTRRIPALEAESPHPLPGEKRVIRAGWIRAAAQRDRNPQNEQDILRCEAAYEAAVRMLSQYHFAVIDHDQPGVTLHLQAPAIEPMTRIDLLFEGRPAAATSFGEVIDQAIGLARDRGEPIQRITLTGHAGLPGCCALGSRLEDCVFDGQLSDSQKAQFRRLRPYLAEDAVIELRQCSSAAGDEGTALLTAIHHETHCAVMSYIGDFRFGFSERATYKRIDVEGRVEVIEPERRQ